MACNNENTEENTADMINQEAKVSYLYSFPDEVLLEIFKRVRPVDLKQQVRKVCQRFQSVSQDHTLCRKISWTRSYFSAPELDRKLAPYICISEVDLSGSVIIMTWLPGDRNYSNIHLETLNLSNVRFTECWMPGLPRLTPPNRLYVKGVDFMLKKFRPRELIANNDRIFSLPNKYDWLEALSMEMVGVSSRKCFAGVNFPHLKEMNFSNSQLNYSQLFELCHLPESTEKFMLNNVDLTEQYLMIFKMIVRSASNLKSFGVSLQYLKNPKVLQVLRQLDNLESLRMYHFEWESLVTSGKLQIFLVSILNKLPNLKHIHFVTTERELDYDLRQAQEDEIRREQSTLRNHINTHLGIDTEVCIYGCDWELHFITKPAPPMNFSTRILRIITSFLNYVLDKMIVY